MATVGAEPQLEAASARTRRPLARAIGRQFLLALVTLLLISVITFASTNIKSPIDVARNALGRFADPQALVAYAHAHGLYESVYARYGVWLGDFVRGNWGISPVTNEPVKSTVITHIERTAILAAGSMVLALVIGILLGASAARHPATKRDSAVLLLSIVLASLPSSSSDYCCCFFLV